MPQHIPALRIAQLIAILIALVSINTLIAPPIAHADSTSQNDSPQISITCPATLDAILDPVSGAISIPTYDITNNSTCDIQLSDMSLTKSESLTNDDSLWNCLIGMSNDATNETLAFTNDKQTINTNITLESSQSKTISWNTTLTGTQAGKHIGEQLVKISYSFAPIKSTYAIFSSDDGSLDFYKRYEKPNVGDTWNGRTVSAIYTGFETTEYATIDYDDGDGIVSESDTTTWYKAITNVPWFENKNAIKTVNIIDEGITPKSLRMWFFRCVNLENADLSRLDASNITDASRFLLVCNKLETVKMPSFTSKLTNIADLISFCPMLRSVDLSASDLSGVTSLFHFARNDSSLEKIIFPMNSTMHLDSDALVASFSNCSALNEIDGVNTMDVTQVTMLSSTFINCSSLNMLDLSSWCMPNATNIDYAFSGCTSLATIDLGFLSEAHPTSAAGLFKTCKNLESIANFNTIDFSYCTIMSEMFSECELLKALDTSNLNASSATDLKDMFFHCYSLSYLDLNNFSLVSATNIGRLFDGCRNIIKIDGMNTWDLHNVKTAYQMFYSCRSLQEIDMSSWNLKPEGTIQATFYKCANVRELDLSGWDLTNIYPKNSNSPQYKIFVDCFHLEKITVSDKWYWYDASKDSLPIPSQNYISGVDGLWYDLNTGIGYSPSDLPSHVATTYVTVKP